MKRYKKVRLRIVFCPPRLIELDLGQHFKNEICFDGGSVARGHSLQKVNISINYFIPFCHNVTKNEQLRAELQELYSFN